MKRQKFSELALSYLQEVTAFAHHLADEEWQAEDLVQSTYEKAFGNFKALRTPGKCRAWLFQITRNLWIDTLRSSRAAPCLELIDPTDSDSYVLHSSHAEMQVLARGQLQEALTNIPPAQQEAVVLCDVWGFSYQEIAEIVDVAVGTIRSRIARGRVALVKEVGSQTKVNEALEEGQ